MNKKRIAICFFGQMRLFEGINKYFSAWNENSNDYAYDFFMSSWDDFDTDRITIDFVDKAFHNEEQITSTWEAGHTQKAAFHIKSVLDLKQKHEVLNNFAYDKVVTIRPDVLLDQTELEKIIDTLSEVNNSVSVTTHPRVEEEGYLRLDSDLSFIYDTDIANIHAGMYSFFYLSKKFKLSNYEYREGGHWIHPFYFREMKIPFREDSFNQFLIRPTRDINVFDPELTVKELLIKLGTKAKQWELEDDLITSGSAVREFKGRLL